MPSMHRCKVVNNYLKINYYSDLSYVSCRIHPHPCVPQSIMFGFKYSIYTVLYINFNLIVFYCFAVYK